MTRFENLHRSTIPLADSISSFTFPTNWDHSFFIFSQHRISKHIRDIIESSAKFKSPFERNVESTSNRIKKMEKNSSYHHEALQESVSSSSIKILSANSGSSEKKDIKNRRKHVESCENMWNHQFDKQGRIHGYPSHLRVGRSYYWGHQIIWAGAVQPKTSKTQKK